jgi:hypothetical protein
VKVIYEYRCDNGHALELMFPLGDAPDEVDCFECGDQDNSCSDPECCGGPWPFFLPMYRLPARGNFATFPGSHNAEYRR